ncbi:MAG: inverse autotransporter beta domain-containing protein [Legionellales bacterium]|nr:inverse autotransporter beta domain-containing protein [Legionellales bacterium]
MNNILNLKLKALVLILLPMCLSHGDNDNRYQTRIEMTGKIGYSSKKSSKRNIARLGFVVPIFQEMDSYVSYLTLIGMKDSAKHVEGNIGAGYRSFLNPAWIFGEYVFYDLRSTENNNLLGQITIGLEAFSKDIEIRLNGYLPTKKKYELKKYNSFRANYNSHQNNTQLTIKHNELLEQGVPGFDIEFGGNPWRLSRLELFLAYYYFNGKNLQSTIGGRLRSNINILHWLMLETEMNFDNNRKFVSYFGAKLSWVCKAPIFRTVHNWNFIA